MQRSVYCHGRWVDESEAYVSIFDRAFLFADAVYEVTAVLEGHMIDNDLHLARLERSLHELDLPLPMALNDIKGVQQRLIDENQLDEGLVYVQVSRGTEERSYTYSNTIQSHMVGFTQAKPLVDTRKQNHGVSICLSEDNRWLRRDIKTTMLLGQVLIKQYAQKHGFDDAWMVEDGLVTEGASSSAFIVTDQGQIKIRPNSHASLPGCTRKAVLRLCKELNLNFVEQAFGPDEAKHAQEAFLTSASSLVTPVIKIDEVIIGNGKPGPLTRQLQNYYLREALGK